MIFRTPDSLYPSSIAILTEGTVYVLCHPIGDGPVNMDRSIVFEIGQSGAIAIRIFDIEIVGLTSHDNMLFCVDGSCGMYCYKAGAWVNWPEVGNDVPRINALRTVRGEILGVGYDGVICRWDDQKWIRMTEEVEDLYLYDVAEGPASKILVAGEQGLLGEIDGNRIVSYQTGTNTDLSCVLPIPHDRFVATGWKSTVLVGDRFELSPIDAGSRTFAFANAVVWNEKVLIAGTTEILELSGNLLSTFSSVEAERLFSQHGQLWKQSEKGVAIYAKGIWNDVPLEVQFDSGE